MKAIVKHVAGPGLILTDVPLPEIQDNEVLIKVLKTSLCGTDVHILKWDAWAQKNVPVPLVIGHEFMGEIAKVGKKVKNLKVGTRVSGEGHITCGVCPKCQKDERHLCIRPRGIGYHVPGAFAEYVKLPQENVFPLPDFISDDLAAILDPLGNATHTALFFPVKNQDVLITGAGPIGIMAAAIARHEGARHVVISNTNDYRLDLATQLGATQAVNILRDSLPAITKKLGIEYGYNVGMEMSGNPSAFNSLLELMQTGGKIALLGILPPATTIDWDLVIFKMLGIQGIYGRKIFETWHQMVHLIENRLNIAPIITHQFSYQDFAQAFDVVMSKKSGKVILNW